MKKILVTSNIRYDKYGNLQNSISQDWFQFLNRLGFSIFTTGIINDKQIKSEFTKINGVIFSGGNDLFSVNKKRQISVYLSKLDFFIFLQPSTI